jgi:hypothetical protein
VEGLPFLHLPDLARVAQAAEAFQGRIEMVQDFLKRIDEVEGSP